MKEWGNLIDVLAKKDGLLVFVKKDFPSKCLQSFHLPEDMQVIVFEISLKYHKLLVLTKYQSPDRNFDNFLSSITVVLDHYLQHCEDYIILGDFNESEHNPKI